MRTCPGEGGLTWQWNLSNFFLESSVFSSSVMSQCQGATSPGLTLLIQAFVYSVIPTNLMNSLTMFSSKFFPGRYISQLAFPPSCFILYPASLSGAATSSTPGTLSPLSCLGPTYALCCFSKSDIRDNQSIVSQFPMNLSI